jgi:hypothetical protein
MVSCAAVAAGAMVVCAGAGLAAEPGPTATSTGTQASGAGIKVGPVGISESRAGKGQKPSWALARVDNTVLLGRGPNGWIGTAAAAGDAIDGTGETLCPDVVSVDGTVRGQICLGLLPADVAGNSTSGYATGAIAVGTIFVETPDAAYDTGFLLVPSSASHTGAGCSHYADSSAALAVLFTRQPNGDYKITQVLSERAHRTTNAC